jgi:hypothetical protein
VHEACREAKNDACRVLVDKSEGQRLPVRSGVNLRIILKLNFTEGWKRGPDNSGSGQGQVAVFCQHGFRKTRGMS